jgi:AAA ATPase domain
MTMTELETILPRGRQAPNPASNCFPTLGVGVQLQKNPYSLGVGLRPVALVGRDGERQDRSVALQRFENARSAKSVVLHGLRGEGRTTLLGEFHRLAEQRDGMRVIIEANTASPLRNTLARALYPAVRELVRPSAGDKLTKALATFKVFSVKVDLAGAWSFGLEVASERGRCDSGELEADLSELIRDLSEAAQEQSRGLAILIDEAQDLTRDELKALCAICHRADQLRWPLLVAFAGLPSLPRALSKAHGFAKHLFRYWEIAQLQDGPAWQALTGPAAGAGVSWDEEALRYVMTESQGHPYFLQEYGQATWDAAEGVTLTYDDARVGVGQVHLDAGLYRCQWEQATHAQRAYLKAMALDGVGSSQSADVAARLRRTPMAVGPVRDSLIKRGLIYSPKQGQIAYAVLGMADFIARQSRP